MSKFKLFVENILIYGLGGIISKIIPLIMVPIVTRLMPNTTYFGISDMCNVLLSIATAIAIMGMYDAMYRLFFEKEDENYKKRICSTTLFFTVCMSVLIFFVLIIFKKPISGFFLEDEELANMIYIVAIATLVGGTNSIVSAPTRMQNKRKIFLITNALSPVLSYAVSIPLLLNGCYIIALPLASLIANLTLEISFYILNRKWFCVKDIDLTLLKPMLVIALPLFPNFLIYWLFNSSDKVMITRLIDIGASGIYSVGSKLGQASQLIYTAFAGGWQFFAFSTMKEKNQVKTNSLVFEYLGTISFIASMFVFALAYPIYDLLFPDEYLSGYIVSPYLFLAPLMQMLFQIAANQFLVVKKTWPNMLILGSGAIINVILNFALIPTMGIEGASIATLLGYVISDIICVVVLCKMELMVVSKRFLSISALMLAFIMLWRFVIKDIIWLSIAIAIVLSVIYVLLYKDDLKKLFGSKKSKE